MTAAHWWNRLTPAWLNEQAEQAATAVEQQRATLDAVDARERRVNEVVARLEADRRANHYGPTIARALGANQP